MGQFTQLDPIGMAGGLNLYGYANGDPVNFRDPSGLMAEETCTLGESILTCEAAWPALLEVGHIDCAPVIAPCRISPSGLDMISLFEEFRSQPYMAQEGQQTVGYGHVILPGESFSILTRQEARDLLMSDVARIVNPALDNLSVGLQQNQVDAVGSLIFNIGGGAFNRSNARRQLNRGRFDAFGVEAAEFRLVNGAVSRGLVRRRSVELRLFFTGVYPTIF